MRINLKLKVKKSWGSIVPTSVFWVDDFLDTENLTNLLQMARIYAASLTYDDVVNMNEIHLNCVLAGGDWKIEPKSKIKPTFEDIRTHTLQITGLSEFDFMEKSRKEPRPLIRSVVAAAYYHFLKLPFSQIEESFPINRSSIYLNCKNSLPKFLNSNNLTAQQTIRDLSHRYGDPSFLIRCQEGNFMYSQKYEG